MTAVNGRDPLIVNGVDFTETMVPAEVAAIFRVCDKTVWRWASKGKLAVIRTPGGVRRYSRAQVLALLRGELA